MSRKQRIHDALSEKLIPDTLNIEDETNQHRVPVGGETHFKVVVVSTQFETIMPIDRHRLVNSLLAKEFESGLHALSLHLYTPTEWQKKSAGAPASPLCHKHKKN